MKSKFLIKILGFGSVVKEFLATTNHFPDIHFEIYVRSNRNHSTGNFVFKDLSSFTPDNNPTFCCCSINEEKLLRESGSNLSRLQIALPNLELIMEFINAGFFKTGKYFILTNPSDLIAEAIIRKTDNKNVFGLGLSMDRRRYNKILSELNVNPDYYKFDLVGNHWDSPSINFSSSSIYNDIDFLREAMARLKNNIKSEFCGYRPPIKSGVQVMNDAIYALYNNEKLEISGFTKDQDAVGGGILNSVTFEFNQPTPNPIVSTLLKEAITFHKAAYNNLIGKIS